jgi:hypothetical protein
MGVHCASMHVLGGLFGCTVHARGSLWVWLTLFLDGLCTDFWHWRLGVYRWTGPWAMDPNTKWATDSCQGFYFPMSNSICTKEVNKEQPSYRNLSATARRVLQCTCPVAASRKYFSAIHTSPHLTSTHLTPDYVNTIILHLVSVLYTAVNVWNKNLCLLCLINCFHYLA